METVGDCYVAVAGLPIACAEHALVMARFACTCRSALNVLVKELEISLGPDTADLAMRTGVSETNFAYAPLFGLCSHFGVFTLATSCIADQLQRGCYEATALDSNCLEIP